MNQSIAYTNGMLEGMLQIDPISLTDIDNSTSKKTDVFSPYPTSASNPAICWLPWENLRVPEVFPAYPRDSFIGMLDPGEADRMKEEVALSKKRFNDDFVRKHQILFGE